MKTKLKNFYDIIVNDNLSRMIELLYDYMDLSLLYTFKADIEDVEELSSFIPKSLIIDKFDFIFNISTQQNEFATVNIVLNGELLKSAIFNKNDICKISQYYIDFVSLVFAVHLMSESKTTMIMDTSCSNERVGKYPSYLDTLKHVDLSKFIKYITLPTDKFSNKNIKEFVNDTVINNSSLYEITVELQEPSMIVSFIIINIMNSKVKGMMPTSILSLYSSPTGIDFRDYCEPSNISDDTDLVGTIFSHINDTFAAFRKMSAPKKPMVRLMKSKIVFDDTYNCIKL